jgi:hypothetical protein
MIPWVRLTTDLRRTLYLNSIDNTRKDQWVWMQRYEKMLVEKLGERARFLPKDEAKHDPARRSAVAPAVPEFVEFE